MKTDDSCFENDINVYIYLDPYEAVGQPFCKKILIAVDALRGLRKKSDCFRCEKISQKLKYLNSKCEQMGKYFFRLIPLVSPICACSMRKIFMATGERWESKSGFMLMRLQ